MWTQRWSFAGRGNIHAKFKSPSLIRVVYRDVEPFLEAVDNLTTYYCERGVDILKQAISGR